MGEETLVSEMRYLLLMVQPACTQFCKPACRDKLNISRVPT